MSTGYRHGVYTSEQPTSILPARTVDSAVVFAVGTAAVHTLGPDAVPPVNEPRIYYSYDEFVQAMGWDADHFNAYTLQELIYAHFALYRGAPVVCVNVFDPARHKSEVSGEAVTFGADSSVRLAHPGVSGLTLTSASGAGYEEGKDYLLDRATGTLTRLGDGTIAADAKLTAAYSWADVSKVTAEDIIGGIEADTGASTGLELIDEVFPRFRVVPSIVLAPHFCEDDAVAVVMAAKCDGINGLFKAICLVDIPTDGEDAVTRYSDVPGYKEKHNLTDPLMLVCWPKVKLGDDVYGLATHMAGLMASTDADHEGIPYASPSNKRLDITSCGYTAADGSWKEVWLDLQKANYLNGQGVYTVSNFDGGMKSWGGRMACYPSNTDPKDAWDSIRRFFNWYQAKFILTYFAKVDSPLTRRLVQTFLKSEQIALDGYTAREIILGGSISFDETENPVTDLMDGIMRFHLRLTPPPPARDVEAIFEFDPDNLKALFS
ncbi:MAG: phage tail sheath protein [Desulfovibrio sp.]|nr:phage tail sheath protein [Desulfovibrio sp.]